MVATNGHPNKPLRKGGDSVVSFDLQRLGE